MSALAVAAPRPRPRTRRGRPIDRASRALFQAVMADGWRPEEAARSLLAAVHDDHRLLRLLRARVVRALLERPSELSSRAEATLDSALGTHVPEHSGPTARERGSRV